MLIIDNSEWEEWDLPTLPFTVMCSPYGETIEREFATEDEANEFANEIRSLKGEYMTSWGMQPVNTDVTVCKYTKVKGK